VTGHLDLDTLADVLAGEAPDGALEHLTDCAECRAAFDQLRTASAQTAAMLAALPAVPLPDDVADRLASALRSAGGSAGGASLTTLPVGRGAPASSGGPARWLGAAAAVAVLLAGAGYGISRLGGGGSTSTSSAAGSSSDKAAGAAAGLHLVRNSTGADYTSAQALAAAVPTLLSGKQTADRSAATAGTVQGGSQAGPNTAAGVRPQATVAQDPLARLRTDAGLADCLVALLPPDDPSVQPLALDYAQYKGQSALVVVMPSSIASKLDVFVVGPGCSQANDSTLFYTSVDKP
jgi:hypothetical protein